MADYSRYERQMILPEVDRAGQERLSAASVLVVGAGGLGCPIITYLSAAGVGRIRIADADRVEKSNLHRQPLFTDSDIGSMKAQIAVQKGVNPEVVLEAFPHRITAANVEESLSGIDVIVDGSDNFATKYLLSDVAVHFGKPLVYGAVFGFEGQISVFNALLPNGERGPTYRCLYPDPAPAGMVPSCAEAGVLGVLPGIVGTVQALETLKIILGIGDLLSGRLLIFDALTLEFTTVEFDRSSIASQDHADYTSRKYEIGKCSTSQVKEISSQEVKTMLQEGRQVTLIDVREPSEKREFDIGGANIPSGQVRTRADEIPRDLPVILYCRSGGRSAQSVEILQRDFGFDNLLSLRGGTLMWE